MSRKEDMIDALSGRAIPERIPTWELEFHLWNKFSSERFIVGEEFTKLASGEQSRALERNAEIICTVSEELEFSAVTLPGAYWESAPGTPAYYWLPDDARTAQMKHLKKLSNEQLFLIVHTGAAIGMPGAGEYMEFAYKLFDAPEEIEEMARQRNRTALSEVRRWRDLGADGFLCADDQADNRGPYFNPEQLNRFVYPFLTRWAEAVSAAGGYSIMHTDGNIMSMLDGIADCGIHATWT